MLGNPDQVKNLLRDMKGRWVLDLIELRAQPQSVIRRPLSIFGYCCQCGRPKGPGEKNKPFCSQCSGIGVFNNHRHRPSGKDTANQKHPR
jgi:hypothetical protein